MQKILNNLKLTQTYFQVNPESLRNEKNEILLNSQVIKKKQKLVTLIIGVQLFVLSAFKSNSVGADIPTYFEAFYYISTMHWSNLDFFNWEYGYVFLNKFVSFLVNDFRFFILVISLIVVITLCRYVYINSQIQWLSFYLFVCMGFFNFSLSGYRQSIAMAITLYSIKYVRERRFFSFLFCVFIASLFHQAALVLIIIYPISKIKINFKYLLTVSMVSICVYIFGSRITNFLLSIYHRKQIVVQGEGQGMFIMLLIITISGLIFLDHAKKSDRDITLYCHMMILAVVLQILSFHLSIFVRVVSYFSIHMIVFIPNIIAGLPSKQLRFIGIMLTCILAVGFYIYSLMGNSSGTMPYQFMW